MTEHREQMIIIGTGSAGLTAAIYAARANIKPLVIAGLQPGGQLTITTDVENYPGFAEAIQGPWLMEQMQKQAEHVGARITYDLVSSVDFSLRPFRLNMDSGDTYLADTVVIATGAQARWLGLESEKTYNGKGVSACATCDGFFYRGKKVAVVGGGNTAVEEALYLSNLCERVTLIHRRDQLRAEKVMQDRLEKTENINIIWNHVVEEVLGDAAPMGGVTGIRLQSTEDESTQELAVGGLFVAIGHDPATAPFRGHIDLDDEGYIVVAPGRTQTSVDGVFAAGDCVDKIYRQAVTAAGMGCMAALDTEKWLAAQS
ncbi:MAG: thioredoxin-disulfide reductase [Candidatus Puniceispirillales bacterium]